MKSSHQTGGAKVTEEWLQVAALTVDPAYQRPINDLKVRKIAAAFDPDAIGVLYVSERDDGTHAVLDGQQRRAALMLLGWADQQVPCHVYHGLSQMDEAHLFTEFNVLRTKPKPIEIFKASVVAGDPDAIAVGDVVSSCGLHFSAGPGPNGIQAVDACRWVYGNAGGDVLKLTLLACKRSWAFDPACMPFQGKIIRALAVVFSRYRSRIDMARLVGQLQKTTPSQLLNKARLLKSELGGAGGSGAGSGRLVSTLGTMFVTLYNRGLRNTGKSLPAWENRSATGFWKAV